MKFNAFMKTTQVRDVEDWSICASSGIYSITRGVKAVFPTQALQQDVRGSLFLYLFRRFGYPIHGTDPYKSVVSYFLTTPDPHIILWCNPSSTLRHSFGYGITSPLEEEGWHEYDTYRSQRLSDQAWQAHPLVQRIHQAVCDTLCELYRPVLIYGTPYNLLGHIPEGSEFRGWSVAAISDQAGYGIGTYNPAREDDEQADDSCQTWMENVIADGATYIEARDSAGRIVDVWNAKRGGDES